MVICYYYSIITNDKSEPNPVIGRCDLLWSLSKYSLKNSSKGDPSGNWGIWFWELLSIIVVEAMLTTAGDSFSTRSAKLSGAALAKFVNNKKIVILF